MAKKSKVLPRNNFSYKANKITNNTSSKPYNHLKAKIIEGPKYLVKSLHDQRWRLGQCFRYENKYVLGHQWNSKGLHIMERIKHEDEEFFVVVKGENNVIVGEEIRSMSHYWMH